MLSILSLASAVIAAPVYFHLESKNSTINGSGVFDLHFQDMINAVIVDKNGFQYQLNTTDNTLYSPIYLDSGMVPLYFGQLSGTHDLVAEQGASATPAYVINNYLTINGSSSVFYTCTDLSWDPLNVDGEFGQGIAIYAANEVVPSFCEPVKVGIRSSA